MRSADVVEMTDVWVRFNGAPVLEEVNLDVREGEIISIVGPNGGGKTTLLHTILGFIKPFRGEVRVFGDPPGDMQAPGRIGYLPQQARYDRVFPVTVRDVVAMSRHARKPVSRKLSTEDRAIITRTLRRVEMENMENRRFGELSGGQKQRVLIARALAGEPRLLILDEPSTGLDAVAQDTFYQLLKRVRDEENLTIVMVSHDIGSVSSQVDRIACLNRKMHYHGKPDACIPSDALEKVFGQHVHFLLHDEHCQTCGHRK